MSNASLVCTVARHLAICSLQPSRRRRWGSTGTCIQELDSRTLLVAPVITGLSGAETSGATQGVITVDADVEVSDADSATFQGGWLRIDLIAAQAGDEIVFSASSGFSRTGNAYTLLGAQFGEHNNDSGVIELNETATPELIQGLLRSLQFETTSSSNATRTVSIKLSDNTGEFDTATKQLNFLPTFDELKSRIITVTESMRGLQYTDRIADAFGAIRISYGPGSYDTAPGNSPLYVVRQYFSNFHVISSLQAELPGSVESAQNWIQWYLKHLQIGGERDGMVELAWYDINGQLPSPEWRAANTQLYLTDADDSDAAMFLVAVREFQKAGGDLNNFLTEIPDVYSRIERVAEVLLRLQREDGLTWGKLTYPVKYSGDNSEVYAGLIAMAEMQKAIGNATAAPIYKEAAERVKEGLTVRLFNAETGLFHVSLQDNPDGTQFVTSTSDWLKKWYPVNMIARPGLNGVWEWDSQIVRTQLDYINSQWDGTTSGDLDWTSHRYGEDYRMSTGGGFRATDIGYAMILSGDVDRGSAAIDWIYEDLVLQLDRRGIGQGGFPTDAGFTNGDIAFLLDGLSYSREAVQLSSTMYFPWTAAETVVATLSTGFNGMVGQLTYGLDHGLGDDDNELFEIVGDQLRTKVPLNLSDNRRLKIRLHVKDASGIAFDTALILMPVQAPTLSSPAETTTSQRPVAQWSPVDGAVSYDVWLNDMSNGTVILVQTNVSTTSFTPATNLGIGSFALWVRSADAAGNKSAWSPRRDFRVNTAAVFDALIRNQETSRPAVRWAAVPGAAKYDIWIDNRNTNQTQFIRQQNLTTNSWTPTSDMPLGVYRAWVRAIDAGGNAAAWSLGMEFRVTPRASMQPVAAMQTTSRPTFAWNALGGASKYDLWIDNRTTGQSQYIRNQNLTTTSFTPPANMPIGQYRLWIRAFDSTSYPTAWIDGINFTVGTPPQLVSPVNSTFNRRPAFTWNAVTGAQKYEVQVRNLTTGATIHNVTNITTTSWTPPADLPKGSYRWWVVATGANNVQGLWTAPVDINIGGQTHMLTPSGSTTNTKPLFSWKQVDGAVRYELWVTNTTLNTTPINLTNLTTLSYTPGTMLPKGNYRAWMRAVSSTGEIAAWSAPAQFTISLLELDSSLNGDVALCEVSLASPQEAVLRTSGWLVKPENENFRTAQVLEDVDGAAEVQHPDHFQSKPEQLNRPNQDIEFAVSEDSATERSEIEDLDKSLADLLMTRLHFQAID